MRRTALILHPGLGRVWGVSSPSWAADRKAWGRLPDCEYVEQAYNDGDSVHVQCGAQEFSVRLYFCRCPRGHAALPGPHP